MSAWLAMTPYPYGFEADPVSIIASLVGAAVAGLLIGAVVVAITAAARAR